MLFFTRKIKDTYFFVCAKSLLKGKTSLRKRLIFFIWIEYHRNSPTYNKMYEYIYIDFSQYGFNMVIQHREAINCIALSLIHKSLR